jgi:alanine racemase
MTEIPLRYPHVAIHLDNVIHNLHEIRRFVPAGKGIIAVVKDCAYGCGSVMVAQTLEQNGVSHLAVATPGEARVLRDAKVTLPILVFGVPTESDLEWGYSNNIIFSLNDLGDIAVWKASGKAVRFHCAVDTGMGRLGILPQEAGQVIDALKNAPALTCDGIYTHCAQADEPGTARVSLQLDRFREVLDLFIRSGIKPRHVHYANSAALLRFPLEPACTLVRPGISLYGCKPDPAQDFGISLKPVVTLKSHVVKIKRVPLGTPVSYGGRYVTKNETHIATISLGYGQGLPRVLGNKGSVLIRGRRYAIAGTVTMDYIMVDAGRVTDVAEGDEAVAIGCQGSECITADDVALAAGTIGYEILCGLGPHLDRYYYLDGKVVNHLPANIY